MTEVAVDRLRLRGPHAQRLARVAARALPGALDRALSDVGDVVIEELSVTLDLDVDQYDDETLAILWAAAIRARVLAEPRSARTTAATDSLRLRPPATYDTPAVLAAAMELLAQAPSSSVVLPRALLGLADPAIARAVAGALSGAEWARLVERLRMLLAPAHRQLARPMPGLGGSERAPASADGLDQPEAPEPASAPAERHDAAARTPHRPAPEEFVEVLALLGTLDEMRTGTTRDLDPASLTRAAGLVLLHPWLADHCRRAEELHPGLDASEVREAALAALVSDDDLGLNDDLLIRWLAGRDVLDDAPRDRVGLPYQDEVRESALRVLASFSGLLPGFETSSPAFVRDAWIARVGIVDVDHDPVQLTAATHPLDVMLPQLPYPVGLIKLPWTGPLSVRFRP